MQNARQNTHVQSHGAKPARQSFRDSDDFQRFRTLLQAGFVLEGTDIPVPELLEFTESLARILQRSDRQDSDTGNHFKRIFQQLKGLQQDQDAVEIEVELRMLKARLAYADGRQAISRNFHLVMQESIDSVLGSRHIPAQLPGLCGFLEALYGYYYYHTQRDIRRRRS